MNANTSFALPKNLIERVRQLAKRQARPLDDILVEALERGLPLLETSGEPAGWEQESETFTRMHPIWRKEYVGEYVAVCRGQLIGHDPTFEVLFEYANTYHPDEFVLIRRVQDAPEITYYQRSIRWAAG